MGRFFLLEFPLKHHFLIRWINIKRLDKRKSLCLFLCPWEFCHANQHHLSLSDESFHNDPWTIFCPPALLSSLSASPFIALPSSLHSEKRCASTQGSNERKNNFKFFNSFGSKFNICLTEGNVYTNIKYKFGALVKANFCTIFCLLVHNETG